MGVIAGSSASLSMMIFIILIFSGGKLEDAIAVLYAQKKLGGGVINSQIHELDYCIYLFGKPKKVYAFGGKLSK